MLAVGDLGAALAGRKACGARCEARRTHATAGGAATEMTVAEAAAVVVAVPAEPDPTLEEQSPPAAAATVAAAAAVASAAVTAADADADHRCDSGAAFIDHAGAAPVPADLRCPRHCPRPLPRSLSRSPSGRRAARRPPVSHGPVQASRVAKV